MDFRVRQLVYELIVMSCAGNRSNAATFGGSTPGVTSWWAGAQTAKEERREGGKWFFEKNKRVVLKMHDETGRCRYWRAPRPRPRPHRRQKRRRQRQIVRAALSNDRPSAETPANEVIRVLQASLCTVILRAETAERELQAARSDIQDRDLHAASGQLRGPSVALGAAQQTTPKPPGVRKRQQPAKALDDAASALDHRTAVWSPFRKGSSLRAPADETAADIGAMPHVQKFVSELVDKWAEADRQEERDQDRAVTAHRQLNSAILGFKARCGKIESKLERLAGEDMTDEKQERRLWALYVHVHADFADFFETCNECG